jgi:hypothetical protein
VGARRDGRTRWIDIDIDLCGDRENLVATAERDRVARIVLSVLAPASPLIVETPSGGLRILIAIPECDIRELLDWSDGRVTRLLNDAGLDIGCGGDLELYPRIGRDDRLLVGACLPELDPDTLQPLSPAPEAEDRIEFSRFVARRIERLECLALRADHALISRILTSPIPCSGPKDEAPCAAINLLASIESVFHHARRLARYGLAHSASRYEAEFRVAMLLIADPNALTAIGIPAHRGTVHGIADALATWLSVSTNGFSEEWKHSIRKNGGSVEAARIHWRQRYLRGHARRKSLIHRAQRAVVALFARHEAGRRWNGGIVGPGVWDAVSSAATRQELSGADRFKFEVWASSLIAASRTIHAYRLAAEAQQPPKRRKKPIVKRGGLQWFQVPIAARWMSRWPGGGGGTRAAGERSYMRYRQIAADQGLLRFSRLELRIRRARGVAANDGFRGLPADEYLVRMIDDESTPPIRMHELTVVCARLGKRARRKWHPMEVQHLLQLRASNADWETLYGTSTGRRYGVLADLAYDVLTAVREVVGVPGAVPGTQPSPISSRWRSPSRRLQPALRGAQPHCSTPADFARGLAAPELE